MEFGAPSFALRVEETLVLADAKVPGPDLVSLAVFALQALFTARPVTPT